MTVDGTVNGESSPTLLDRYLEGQREAIDNIGDAPLSEIESLAAWRRTFTGFGVKPTQYRSAVEALLRRLTKVGDIPSINSMVDIANLVSIRHRLPVAVFDQARVTGDTVVRFADGTESFTDLGSDVATHPEPGEVVFVDEAGLVSARRWCWRQSGQSAAGPATTSALITIEGHHSSADSDVQRAMDDFASLLGEFQPQASTQIALLGPNQASTHFDES